MLFGACTPREFVGILGWGIECLNCSMLLVLVCPRLFPLTGTALCFTVDMVGPCLVDVMTGDGACFIVDIVGAIFEVGSES